MKDTEGYQARESAWNEGMPHGYSHRDPNLAND